jgi:hypothetical protein
MEHSEKNKRHRISMSIPAGNLIQVTGLAAGFILSSSSTQPTTSGTAMMIAGYLLVYFSSHSLSHYVVGRLAGIRFSHYSLGGSSHASAYPPVMRQLFERLPFFSVHAEADSMKAATSSAKGSMFLAGVIGTVVFSTLATLCAYGVQARGALILLGFNIFWQIGTIITEARPGGDIAKARKSFRS